MTLLLTEADVRSLLTMPVALEAVEESLRHQGEGEVWSCNPRRRLRLRRATVCCIIWRRRDPVRGYFGMKLYTSGARRRAISSCRCSGRQRAKWRR